ncbi:uncharacterized protein M421DRAFT_123494 [Didymella exigua CBS 183.55]|uniref:Secreted protein n=1 Tax=Didymella exigua CBS 183.55 TaxID=1150837 RepID=A0A6A5RR77_9PLEO|nr:uncharacterized protein M421DRAFT_123494 [Didymella exigua CBS 183.55]KAF1929544.1 hypothetical protein M421DRAFT_123494 [Didymella exigua CBS 183.55]
MWRAPLWELGICTCSLARLEKACEAKSNSHACICTTQRSLPRGDSHHAFALSLLHVAPMPVCRVTRETYNSRSSEMRTNRPAPLGRPCSLSSRRSSCSVIESRSGNDHDNCKVELGQLQSA